MIAILRNKKYPYAIKKVIELDIKDSDLKQELLNYRFYIQTCSSDKYETFLEFFDGTVERYNDSNS